MTELTPSELGTQQFWDNQYQLEINNFRKHGDVGEIWFGEHIGKKIIHYLNKSNNIDKDSNILDVGCGNGMLLVELAEEGYKNLLGVDYSLAAIELAEEVAKEHKWDIKYKVCDLLVIKSDDERLGEFNVVLDKGTYDAISLNEGAKEKRHLYLENVYNLVRDEGLFIITSCSWTQSELEAHFKDKFRVLNVIPTPQLQFGGSCGKTITSIVFQKL